MSETEPQAATRPAETLGPDEPTPSEFRGREAADVHPDDERHRAPTPVGRRAELMAWGDNTYPGSAAPESGGYDRIGYAWAQCASFCNQQIMDQLQKDAVFWGNGGDWAGRAAAEGLAVDGSPRVGDVICLGPGVSSAAGFGHVGCVIGISADGGSVYVADYNWVAPNEYAQHWLAVAGAQFIHVSPAASGGAGSGITWVFFSGTVQVDDAHVRGGPGTGFPVLRGVTHGTALGFDGYTYAEAVSDPVAQQPDTRWFHIDQAHGYGWIASAMVDGNPPDSHP